MKRNKSVPAIEVKSPDNDFVVVKKLGSMKILARSKTGYDGAREKAIVLGLENPHITREKNLKKEAEKYFKTS